MATTDPILTAITRLEERIVERIGERIDEWRRNLSLYFDQRFDALHQRFDRMERKYERVQGIDNRRPPER